MAALFIQENGRYIYIQDNNSENNFLENYTHPTFLAMYDSMSS